MLTGVCFLCRFRACGWIICLCATFSFVLCWNSLFQHISFFLLDLTFLAIWNASCLLFHILLLYNELNFFLHCLPPTVPPFLHLWSFKQERDLFKPSSMLSCWCVFRVTMGLLWPRVPEEDHGDQGDGHGSQGTERYWICILCFDAEFWKESLGIS